MFLSNLLQVPSLELEVNHMASIGCTLDKYPLNATVGSSLDTMDM